MLHGETGDCGGLKYSCKRKRSRHWKGLIDLRMVWWIDKQA